jgi:type II restriction enzyme
MVEAMGGVLKFDDAADKVFRSNLNLIDLHFPRLLGEMTRMMYLDGTSRVRDLVDKMKELNPLKIKDELIEKHGYYEYKVKQFLMAVALGMRPTKVFDGFTGVVSGFIFVDASGKPLCYSVNDRAVFENFLLNNTRLVHGNVERDHYGYLERENGQWYFRLNAKVALTKK